MGDRTGWTHPIRVMEPLTHNLRSPRVFRHFGWKVLKTLLVLFVLIGQLGPYTYIASPASAASTVPKLLNYQARITDDSGVPVPDGNLNIWISVYDASSGGSCLYAMRGSCGTPSFKTVSVVNGVFSTLIGDTVAGDNAIGDTLFDASTLYLGITVASDTEMVPRKRLTTAPYAMNADRLDGLDVTSSGSTTPYVVSTTANGNLTITGDPQGTGISQGSVYINPASAAANETIFGVADNGTQILKIDKEGDMTIGSASNTSSVVFNARIGSNLTPTTDAAFDLGDYDRRWRDLWLSGGSANIALDTSGTSIMKLGFETTLGLRGLVRTPSGIPLQLRSGLGATSAGLYINGANNVGIGTTVPTTALTVNGASFLSGHVIIGDQFTLGSSTPT